MRAHYEQMVRGIEDKVVLAMAAQVMDENSPYYGAVVQTDGVFQAKSTMYTVASYVTAYCNPDCRYYHDETILARAEKGIDYVERVQHENGLFDFVTCNFFSAPDTAFCILAWIPHLKYLMAKPELTPGEARLKERMARVVHAGGRGLLEGGFHTPNHRWAIASLLACCGRMFDEPDLIQAAHIYLNEGMDCNEDGEYAEKSAGNYNLVNNDAMLMLSEYLGDPAYEQNVLRNLRMMLTYWEPDDTVFTANSTRWDKDRKVFPTNYYFEYLDMGIRYNVPEYIAMANYIMDIAARKRLAPPDFLMEYMNHPDYIDFESDLCGTPREYSAYYPNSGIARVRHDRYTYTVMAGKSNFLYIHNGSIKLAVKLAGSFCEHRAFIPATMARDEDGAFHLHQTMRGWYYLPFKEKPATSDWWKMDNDSREKKLGPDIHIDVTVREVGNALEVTFNTSGVSGAPWRVELAFSGIDRISNPHMTMPICGSEVLVLRDSDFTVSNPFSSMVAGPAFGVHHFTEGKEDSEAKTPGAATVYMTDYTPFHRTITIRPVTELPASGQTSDLFL